MGEILRQGEVRAAKSLKQEAAVVEDQRSQTEINLLLGVSDLIRPRVPRELNLKTLIDNVAAELANSPGKHKGIQRRPRHREAI